MNRTIVVAGSAGMLGADLVEALECAALEFVALPRPRMDITSPKSVRSALGGIAAPGLVINCAAYTAVDKAESEPEAAFAVNRDGPANLADECKRLRIPLIHISTDYVFDGESGSPYKEVDAVNPINVYGLSKLGGEEAVRLRLAEHIIVRTSWLFGEKGGNFVKTILKLGMEREELKVVRDQHGCPTSSFDLAGCLVRISRRILADGKDLPWGTYHFCGKSSTTWYDFASVILNRAKRCRPPGQRFATVTPVPAGAYPTAARRPLYSVLDCAKIEAAFGVAPPAWKESVERCVDRLCPLSPQAPGEGGESR